MIAQLLGRELANRLRSAPEIDPSVAEAMIAVDRHRFVSWKFVMRAYEDRSLPTGPATSISQPTYVATVISFAGIQPDDRVLEIGTGSGYTAAVLGRLAREVLRSWEEGLGFVSFPPQPIPHPDTPTSRAMFVD
jgi:protein-L-isoaspartate O-methyltransferase